MALTFVACGGDSSTTATQSGSNSTKSIAERTKPPKIQVPPGPPPKKLIVKNLKQGTGTVAKYGQELGVRYVSVTYKTGKEFEDRWNQPIPFSFPLGSGQVLKGWEIGLKGIRVGGRRELILPPRLAYGTGTSALIYVVELISVK